MTLPKEPLPLTLILGAGVGEGLGWGAGPVGDSQPEIAIAHAMSIAKEPDDLQDFANRFVFMARLSIRTLFGEALHIIS